MPIVSDAKDWTWVLERPCPDCGCDSSTRPRDQIVPLIEINARTWPTLLGGSTARLRQRPQDEQWSLLEYACHVRDVFERYDERLRLMLDQDNPTLANWDRDRSAVDDRYNEQDPAMVAAQIVVAADRLGASFRSVTDESWERRGTRIDGADFTVDGFGRYMIHDPMHHLDDVNVDIAALVPPPAG
jgi:hypothetical protein